MSSCNDSFMDRYPETNITEQVFFSSPEDLKNIYKWHVWLFGCRLFGYTF